MRKMMILIIFLLSIFTILSSFVPTTHATPLINDIGLPDAPVIINFDDPVFPVYSEGTAITDQYASFGVTFSPGMYYNPIGDPAGIKGISGNYIGNFYIDNINQTIPTNNPFSIKFNNVQTEAAIALATNPGKTTLTARLNGVDVESFTQDTTYTNSETVFLGFTESLFNEISISVYDPINGYNIALVDTIQDCTAVPEPATIFLLGSGLLGVGWLMRKRRA